MRRSILVLLSLSLVAAACSGQVPELAGQAASTSSSSIGVTTTVTPTEPPVVPAELADFDVRPLSIEDGELTYLLTVAVADTPDLRAQGLMGLVDLGDLDGMLFVWPELASSGFWMKDTLIPLDIAFFDADGRWVNNFTMLPCTEAECPTYDPNGSYLYAIEVPDAGFATLTANAELKLDI